MIEEFCGKKKTMNDWKNNTGESEAYEMINEISCKKQETVEVSQKQMRNYENDSF